MGDWVDTALETSMYRSKGLLEEDSDINDVFTTLSGVVQQVTGNTTRIVLGDLKKVVKNGRVKKHMSSVFPYLYTAGFLAFACKPISSKSMSGVMKAIGIEPKKEVASILCDTGIRNCILYIYTIYFLMILGRTVSKSSMSEVIGALNEPFDDRLAEYAIELYTKKQIP